MRRHFALSRGPRVPTVRGMDSTARGRLARTLTVVALATAGGMAAQAQAPLPDAAAAASALATQVRAIAQRVAAQADHAATQHEPPRGARVEVDVGSLDPRLKLAPCARIEPQLPPGTRLWGRTRIALRCAEGPVRWQVYLPLAVKVFAPALTAAVPLAAGHEITAADLRLAEVDLAAEPAPVLKDATSAIGRTLDRPLAPGQALRENHLRARVWFAAGESVRVVAAGPGWRIVGEGLALSPGVEGRSVRVRTESGRVLSALPVAEREVEVPL